MFYPRSHHTKVPFQEIRHFPSCVDLRARSIGLYPHHRYRLVPVQCPYPLIWGSSQCLVVSSLSGRAAAPLSWASGHVSEARPPYPRYQTPSQPPGPTSPLFPETDVIRILNRQHQHQHSLVHCGMSEGKQSHAEPKSELENGIDIKETMYMPWCESIWHVMFFHDIAWFAFERGGAVGTIRQTINFVGKLWFNYQEL